jgi:hypothetical protein
MDIYYKKYLKYKKKYINLIGGDFRTIETNYVEYDVVIVGAGITGCYLAHRMLRQFPDKKILILDRNDRIGGRIVTHNDYSGINCEYGAMRIFKEYQPRITKLISDIGLDLISEAYINKNNFFYCKNSIFYNNRLYPETDSKYFLDENEKNKNVFDTVNNNIIEIYKSKNILHNFYEYKHRYKICSDPSYCALSYKNTIINGKTSISYENWNRYNDINGYSNMYNNKCSFLYGSIENVSLHNKYTQYLIKNGFVELPKKLIQKFKEIDYDDIQNNKENNNILKNTDLKQFKLLLNGNTELILNNNKTNQNKKIVTKELFICVPKSDISKIDGFCSNFISNYIETVLDKKLFKMFLYFDEKDNFWNNLGFISGRCTTTLDLGQIWFYGPNILMTYSIATSADFWAAILPYIEQIEPIDINTNEKIKNIVEEQIKLYQKIFNSYNIKVPLPKKVSWRYYENGVCIWQNLNLPPYNNKSFNDIKDILFYPLGRDKKVYYVNNDMSLYQGWCEGSIEVVDELLHNLYKIPDYLNL